MAFEKTLVCSTCSMASPVFCFLNHQEVADIDEHRIEVTFNPGETIIKSGAPMTHIVSFYDGLAKVTLEGKDGKNFILDFIHPQAFFSGPGLFLDNTHHFTITAVEPCKLCFIDLNIFLGMMKNNSEMAFAFMENSNKFILNQVRKMEALLVKHHHGRVADSLLYLSREIYRSNPFVLSISKKDMSELTGLPKESVSRILHEFRNENIISIEDKNVHILNEKALEQISVNG